MFEFKRNQIEEAVALTLGPHVDQPPDDLLLCIKRLLQADRDVGIKKRGDDEAYAQYAFFSAEPEGTGKDVLFSHYEGFAVLTAVRLLASGWPQGTVVTALRSARTQLEREHKRMLRQRSAPVDLETMQRSAKPGQPAVHTESPVFFCIVSRQGSARDDDTVARSYHLCRSDAELMALMLRDANQSTSVLELAGATREFAKQLSHTEPRKRGRGSA